MSLILFYFLLLFLPTQLAKHFFFDFTLISGIRSDYLTPTIYFTDIIAILLIFMSLRGSASWRRRGNLSTRLSSHSREIPRFARNDKGKAVLLSVICYLLFNVFMIAPNKWAAFYKFIKIMEFILLGIAVSKLKPKMPIVIPALSIATFYSSVIAIWQFIVQKSIGGVFWWMGEPTFYTATPGIAAFSYKGYLLLRPYATFPHPNVLGGFLAVVLPLILAYLISHFRQNHKLFNFWMITTLILGFTALTLSFSRVAWFTVILGFAGIIFRRKVNLSKHIINKKKLILSVFYLLIFLSVVVPLVLPESLYLKTQYFQERVGLIKATIDMVLVNQPFGVGLNNSITLLKNYTNGFPGLYIFQPVHNIYLLILSETGIAGFSFFLILLSVFLNKIIKSKPFLLFSFIQLFVLGLFDHYLFTLQQGQLMLVIFTALIFAQKVA